MWRFVRLEIPIRTSTNRAAVLDIFFGGLLLALIPTPAFAYIDPNAGGYLFSLLGPLLALVASAWLIAKKKLILAFRYIFRRIYPNDKNTRGDTTPCDPP